MWYDVNWLDRCKVIKKVNTPQIIALFFYVCLLVMMLDSYDIPVSSSSISSQSPKED